MFRTSMICAAMGAALLFGSPTMAQNSAPQGPASGAQTGQARPAVPGVGIAPPPRGAPAPGDAGIGRTGSEPNADDAARRTGPSGTSPGNTGTGSGGAGSGG